MLTVPQGTGKGMAAALILNGTKVCTSFLQWRGNDTHYLIGVHHWPPFQCR